MLDDQDAQVICGAARTLRGSADTPFKTIEPVSRLGYSEISLKSVF
jgi:hypothetical protein